MASRDVPDPVGGDHSFLDQAMNIVETLANLNYLICVEADNPELIRAYASHTEERLLALGRLLQSVPKA